ncbi:MAG: G5 domain-containing protein [Candidatus Microsaccharimonas sp.]
MAIVLAFYSLKAHNSRQDMVKKWNNYTRREKAIGIIGAVFGVFVIGSIANGMSNPSPNTSTPATEQVKSQPVITYENLTDTIAIPFDKTTKESNLYDKDTTQVTTTGIDGEKTLTYKVTYVDGAETARELLKEEISKSPVTEVTSIGTYVKQVAPKIQVSSNCDPNYSGACVPIASDVDCAGGSGNGPAYVSGPVNVIGTDIYGLDRDGNNIGCE